MIITFFLHFSGQTLQEIEKFDDPRSDDEFSDEESGRRGTGRLEGMKLHVFTLAIHLGESSYSLILDR